MSITKNIVISGTNFWNPGDDFVRDGVIKILRELFPDHVLNFLFYNFNQDFFPQNKFSGIHNMVAKGNLDQYKDFVDYVVIAGLSAGTEIKDLYNWVIENNLTDRVYLIGAGYENNYVDKHIYQEPELTIFKNAKVITSRTAKAPKIIKELNLPFYHINCPAILSVPEVKKIEAEKKIKRIAFSIQLPHEFGVSNHACAQNMYLLSLDLLSELYKDYEIEIIAHHKSEYFHFLNLFKEYNVNVPVIFSSYYQDLFEIYKRYDLMITTRLHASLFANGHGIPGIILNDTDRHTHCLEGFPHSVWVNSKEKFYNVFNEVIKKPLIEYSKEAESFKQNLLDTYVEKLSPYFGVKKNRKTKEKPRYDKLNIGCGTDYREGFVNIDGNETVNPDYVQDIKPGSLLKLFNDNSFSYILAKDFVEHHYHWEAMQLLEDFKILLKSGGKLEIILPNVQTIINDPKTNIEKKILWLYGGQDITQEWEVNSPDLGRKKYPQYFCHKFGWTKEFLMQELKTIGFGNIKFEDWDWNMRVISEKLSNEN